MIDEWSRLADLLANLIEKYASGLGLDELPAPELENHSNNTEENTASRT